MILRRSEIFGKKQGICAAIFKEKYLLIIKYCRNKKIEKKSDSNMDRTARRRRRQ
jgi:hypothetical protein